MTVASLTFTLPDDRDELELAMGASSLASSIWDIDQWLRSNLKYGLQHPWEELSDEKKELVGAILQVVRDRLWERLNEDNLGRLLS